MMNSTEIHPQTSPFFVLEPGHINVMPDDREHDVIKTKIYFPPQAETILISAKVWKGYRLAGAARD